MDAGFLEYINAKHPAPAEFYAYYQWSVPALVFAEEPETCAL